MEESTEEDDSWLSRSDHILFELKSISLIEDGGEVSEEEIIRSMLG